MGRPARGPRRLPRDHCPAHRRARNTRAREHATVVGAALWGSDTDVSNACRLSKPGTLDDYLCDDRNLEKAEKTCWDVAIKIAELLIGARLGKP